MPGLLGGLPVFPRPARSRVRQWRHAVRSLDPEGRLRVHEVRALAGFRTGHVVARLLPEHWELRAAGSAHDVLELDAQARLLVPVGIRHHLGLEGPLVVSLAMDSSRIAIWPSVRLDVLLEEME